MIRRTAALAALILTLGACTGADETTDTIAPTSPQVEAPATEPDDATPDDTMDVADGPDPVRVLVAVTVLTTGDVEAAVAEGLLTPEEVDAAERAIADDTVADWIERAEGMLAEG
jgi:hypothetical protein